MSEDMQKQTPDTDDVDVNAPLHALLERLGLSRQATAEEIVGSVNAVLDQSVLTDAVVDRWFADTFHNLGLEVELYNRFFAAKESLKAARTGE